MKNKRVLIIKGSARKDGFTNRLCDRVQEMLSDNQIVVFDTFNEAFSPCNGCNYCEKNGSCVHRDLDGFFEEFENADLIIFASPVFNGTFPAPLKGLIDRFQTYYTRFYARGKVQPVKKRREAVFIASAGRDGKKSFDFMKWQLSCAFSILNIELTQAVLCSFTDTEPRFNEALEELKRSFTYE